MARRLTPARVGALVALAMGVVALLLAAQLGGGYTLKAHFVNAGGLVEGGRVTVAGRPVGSISAIDLTPDGQAEVTLSIDDSSITPLREGTRAAIRAVGQATITNNYVALSPGLETEPEIADGGVLPATQTAGIVPIDAIFDSFGPEERRSFGAFFGRFADVYAGSGSRFFNRMLMELDPALAQLRGWSSQVDLAALGRLVEGAARASTAVASRRDDLSSSVRNMAVAFEALTRDRRALNDLLARMPGFLRRARGTLARTQSAMVRLRPMLRHTPAAAGPLRDLLARTASALPASAPAVDELYRQLPDFRRALSTQVPLERPAVAALRTTGPAMRALRPILEGARIYGTDLIVGLFAGTFARTTAQYNHLGHYSKVNFVQSPQTVTTGALSELLTRYPLAPDLLNIKTRVLRRCPGGGEPPAPDGSSPWDVGPRLCTRLQDLTSSVNEP